MGLPVLPSSEQVEVTLVAYSSRCLLAPYFWGLRVLLVGREAAYPSLELLLAVLSGGGGLFVLLVSNFRIRILIITYFLTFYL